MVLQHKDVENFLKCPLLITKFNSPQKPKEQTKEIVRKCITQMFMKEMHSGRLPNYKSLISMWGVMLKGLPKLKAKGHNNILIALKELYDSYEIGYYDPGYRVSAVNFQADISSAGNWYRANIPAVLSRDREVVPVFFTDRVDLYGRDNEFRFGCAALRQMSGLEIQRILVIKVVLTSLPSFTINPFYFNHNELQRAERELRDVLKIMYLGYNTPNTASCIQCQFTGACKL